MSDQPKFTPGPWRWSFDGHGGVCIEADGRQVGFVRHGHEANARLIAAAPEMYEMLREVVAAMDDSGLVFMHRDRVLSALDAIHAFIRRFEGTEADPCSS